MEILTVSELTNYLKCSKSLIRKKVRDREIPFFRIGSKINFDKRKIDEWIENQYPTQ